MADGATEDEWVIPNEQRDSTHESSLVILSAPEHAAKDREKAMDKGAVDSRFEAMKPTAVNITMDDSAGGIAAKSVIPLGPSMSRNSAIFNLAKLPPYDNPRQDTLRHSYLDDGMSMMRFTAVLCWSCTGDFTTVKQKLDWYFKKAGPGEYHEDPLAPDDMRKWMDSLTFRSGDNKNGCISATDTPVGSRTILKNDNSWKVVGRVVFKKGQVIHTHIHVAIVTYHVDSRTGAPSVDVEYTFDAPRR